MWSNTKPDSSESQIFLSVVEQAVAVIQINMCILCSSWEHMHNIFLKRNHTCKKQIRLFLKKQPYCNQYSTLPSSAQTLLRLHFSNTTLLGFSFKKIGLWSSPCKLNGNPSPPPPHWLGVCTCYRVLAIALQVGTPPSLQTTPINPASSLERKNCIGEKGSQSSLLFPSNS